MALGFEDLSETEIRKIGIELAAARGLLGKSSSDFVLDLRTTRHHINAIESADLRIFYGAPFYLDLMKRYAKVLDFSADKISDFEDRVIGKVVEPRKDSFETPAENSQAISALSKRNSLAGRNYEIYLAASEKERGPSNSLSESVAIFPKYSDLRLTKKELGNFKQRYNLLLKALSALYALVLILVYFISSNEEGVSETSSARQGKIIESNNSERLINQKMPDSKISTNINIAKNTKLISVESVSQAETTKKLPLEPSGAEQLAINANPFGASKIETPDIKFDIKAKTWFWIKYADETIDEFAVTAPKTITIDKFPIYVVVGNPERVILTVRGKSVKIERNDPERNIARLTRTQLINLVD